MLIVLILLTAAYGAGVVWVLRMKKNHRDADAAAGVATLPAADQPPATAVGWPPQGNQFTAYVEDGLSEVDAFLADRFTS